MEVPQNSTLMLRGCRTYSCSFYKQVYRGIFPGPLGKAKVEPLYKKRYKDGHRLDLIKP